MTRRFLQDKEFLPHQHRSIRLYSPDKHLHLHRRSSRCHTKWGGCYHYRKTQRGTQSTRRDSRRWRHQSRSQRRTESTPARLWRSIRCCMCRGGQGTQAEKKLVAPLTVP